MLWNAKAQFPSNCSHNHKRVRRLSHVMNNTQTRNLSRLRILAESVPFQSHDHFYTEYLSPVLVDATPPPPPLSAFITLDTTKTRRLPDQLISRD
jgi:hypothetical protein